jgi:hypothetical protein
VSKRALLFLTAAVAAVPTTFDSALTGANMVLSNGDRTVTNDQSGYWNTTFSNTHKSQSATDLTYFEFLVVAKAGTNLALGFQTPLVTAGLDKGGQIGGTDTGCFATDFANALGGTDSSPKFTRAYSSLTTINDGTVVGIAINFTTGKAWIALDNTWRGNPAAGTGESWWWTNSTLVANGHLGWWIAACFNCFGSSYTITLQTSALQQAYNPPAGFLPWDAWAGLPIFNAVLTSSEAGWNSTTERGVLPSALLYDTTQRNGNVVVTVNCMASGASGTITEAWIGNWTGTNQNLDGNQVQLKWGGSPSITINAATDYESDPIPFDFNPGANGIATSFYFSGTSGSFGMPGIVGSSGVYIGGNHAGDTTMTGTNDGAARLVKKIVMQ